MLLSVRIRTRPFAVVDKNNRKKPQETAEHSFLAWELLPEEWEGDCPDIETQVAHEWNYRRLHYSAWKQNERAACNMGDVTRWRRTAFRK